VGTDGARLLEKLPAVKYVDSDVVLELIKHNCERYQSKRVQFRMVNIVSQSLPGGGICLGRQVLQHLPNRDIGSAPSLEFFEFLTVSFRVTKKNKFI
jgi:hypothetical protein